MRELTKYERFMASYIPNVCDRENCDTIQGLCDECYRSLKLAGTRLEEFISEIRREEWEEFCKQLPMVSSKNSNDVVEAWDKECEE